MKVLRSISEAESLSLQQGTVVTVGSFDGVHCGHQKLIETMFEKNSVAKKVILTFSPHPAKVLSSAPPPLIFSEQDQIEVFSKKGVDILFLYPFTKETALLTAERFVDSVILRLLKPTAMVVGHDFSFGKGKQGNFEVLKQLLQPKGVEVVQVPPFKINDVIVSSSKIRQLIASGDVARASQFLGRTYYIEGEVFRGRQLGRTIGFPTVNLKCENELYPALGVYFCHTKINGVVYKCVGNIGVNPTVHQTSNVKVEFHILDYTGDLYGQKLRFELVSMLRPEHRFASVEELRSQIAKDVARAREL